MEKLGQSRLLTRLPPKEFLNCSACSKRVTIPVHLFLHPPKSAQGETALDLSVG